MARGLEVACLAKWLVFLPFIVSRGGLVKDICVSMAVKGGNLSLDVKLADNLPLVRMQ